MYKLGFSTIGCPGYSVDEIVALAVATELRGVELRFVSGTTDLASLEEFHPSRLAETRGRFESSGLEVVAIDTSVRMNSLERTVRAENLELAKRNIEIAVGLGAPFIRVFGGDIPEGQDEAATRQSIVAGLSEVAELSWNSGLQSLLETHDTYSTSQSIVDFFEAGGSERLGVLWDSLHTFRHGEEPEESWSLLGDRIKHVHVKDATVADPQTFDFALPGEGIVPIPRVIEVLSSAGFEGYVDFEWEKGWHPEIAEPDVAIPLFARYMAGLAAR